MSLHMYDVVLMLFYDSIDHDDMIIMSNISSPINDAPAASMDAEVVDAAFEVRHIGARSRHFRCYTPIPSLLQVPGQLLAHKL